MKLPPIFAVDYVGVLLSFIGLIGLTGWVQGLVLISAGVCFAIGRWLAYMKNASSD